GRRLAGELKKAVISFGRSPKADIRPADKFAIDVRGLRGRVHTPAGDIRVESRLLGLPNLYNWMAAIGAAVAVGIPRKAIETGIRRGTYVRMTDRREAIARTIDEASDDDVIVIAGKGHESYQVVGDQIIHFDDREEAEFALKKRHEKVAPKTG